MIDDLDHSVPKQPSICFFGIAYKLNFISWEHFGDLMDSDSKAVTLVYTGKFRFGLFVWFTRYLKF